MVPEAVYGPHLLKSVRNNLQKHDFIFNGKRVKWGHIQQLFEMDVQNSVEMRLVPKLTHNHIYTPPLRHMKVKYASQVFSSTVYAALFTTATTEDSPMAIEAVVTAEFVKTMDDIFDIFNSSNRYDSKQLKCQLEEDCPHWDVITKTEDMFKNLEMYDGEKKCRRPPCFDGWLMDMVALKEIWAFVRDTTGHKSLRTRSIQQDCLENCFAVIRQSYGFNVNPTPCQFRFSLEHLMITSLLDLSRPESANCERDAAQYLLQLGKTTNPSPDSSAQSLVAIETGQPEVVTMDTGDPRTDQPVPDEPENLQTGEVETEMMDNLSSIPDESGITPAISEDIRLDNILYYVTGSCLHKFLKKHKCGDCRDKLVVPGDAAFTDSHQSFLYWKSYGKNSEGQSTNFGCLKVPQPSLFEIMKKVDPVLCSLFTNIAVLDTPLTSVMREVDKINFSVLQINDSCHRQFRHEFLELFVRTRIYFIIKTINQKFSTLPKRKENRKLKNLLHV